MSHPNVELHLFLNHSNSSLKFPSSCRLKFNSTDRLLNDLFIICCLGDCVYYITAFNELIIGISRNYQEVPHRV